jgi:hypothetical protein
MTGRWLATSGLLLTIVGGIILFIFGLTADVNPEGHVSLRTGIVDEKGISEGKALHPNGSGWRVFHRAG